MGENVYKGLTRNSGDDAELYLSRLFDMKINLPGSRKPDLQEGNFFLEIKSGKQGRGQLVDDQLHYGISPIYENDLFNDVAEKRTTYYDIIERLDMLPADEIQKPFSNIRMFWGDQYIIPSKMVFYVFAMQQNHRINNTLGIDDIVKNLESKVHDDASGIPVNYSARRSGKTWQSIDSRFIEKIFDNAAMPESLKGRYDTLCSIYPDIFSLEKDEIKGPNYTLIRFMYYSEDKEHIERLKDRIEENSPMLEEITRKRSDATPLLEMISPAYEDDLFGVRRNGSYDMKLTTEELSLLKKLSVWKA